MYGIFLPDFSMGFIFTHKSGSRLFSNALISFFELMEYKYALMGHGDVSDYITKGRKAKFYIFTRNPYDRFLSSFNWANTALIEQKNYQFVEYFEKNSLNKIDNFVKLYAELCENFPDPHYIPQTYGILNRKYDNNILDGNFNFRKHFDKTFYNYKIINIEDIESLIENDILVSSRCLDERTKIYKLFTKTIDLFDDFSEMDHNVRRKFNFSYVYVKKMLDINHHLNLKVDVTEKNKKIITELFKNEMSFLGYDIK
jgi:hypothetical protein